MTLTRPQQDALWLERLQRDGPPVTDHLELAVALRPSLELLRARRYWQSHESLEDLWQDAPYPLRLFHYALIKVAVGLLHIERRSPPPARRQLAAAAVYLEPFTPAFAGLDTAAILARVRACLDALAAATDSPVDWASLDDFRFPDSAAG